MQAMILAAGFDERIPERRVGRGPAAQPWGRPRSDRRMRLVRMINHDAS